MLVLKTIPTIIPTLYQRLQRIALHCHRQQKRLKPFEFKPFRTLRDIVGVDFGGERGIRTLDTRKRIHTFQACSLSHSDTSPFGRDNNQKNEICQVETIDLEQKKFLDDIIRQNYVYIRRRIYAKYRKKSGIACNYLSSIRCCIWRHWNQSTVCPSAMLPHRTSRYYWSDSSWDSVADFLVHDADHQF